MAVLADGDEGEVGLFLMVASKCGLLTYLCSLVLTGMRKDS
jgi:hypothetical protein